MGLGTLRDTTTTSNGIDETDYAGAQHHFEWSAHGQVSGWQRKVHLSTFLSLDWTVLISYPSTKVCEGTRARL